MAVVAKDLYALLDKIDHHARSIIAVHTEVRAMLAQLHFPKDPEAYPCPHGCTSFASERTLAFHMQNVHGGPAVPLSEEELRA